MVTPAARATASQLRMTDADRHDGTGDIMFIGAPPRAPRPFVGGVVGAFAPPPQSGAASLVRVSPPPSPPPAFGGRGVFCAVVAPVAGRVSSPLVYTPPRLLARLFAAPTRLTQSACATAVAQRDPHNVHWSPNCLRHQSGRALPARRAAYGTLRRRSPMLPTRTALLLAVGHGRLASRQRPQGSRSRGTLLGASPWCKSLMTTPSAQSAHLNSRHYDNPTTAPTANPGGDTGNADKARNVQP